MNASGGIDRPPDEAFDLDARWVRRRFDGAGASYDTAAVLQGELRAELLSRLELTAIEPRLIIDAGAGTGHASRALKKVYPAARVIALDFAPGMLRAAARQQRWLGRFERLCADVHALPLPDACADLIFSNCMLHCCDLERVFAEFRRVLKGGGLLTFSSFGPDTLRELRSAWASVDHGVHVHRFIDMHDCGDALVRAGFSAPVLDVERYTLTYPDVGALAADLKALGERNCARGRPRGLTGPRRFAALRAAYESFRDQGRLPASVEVVFGHAWAAAARGTAATETTVSLAALRAQLPARRSP